jgi:protein arginine kinase activator
VAFEDELEPLLVNIHGALAHSGKVPTNQSGSPERQHRLMQLKGEMKEAIAKEDYETASRLRDKISNIESIDESSWTDDALVEELDDEDEEDDTFQAEPPIV